MNRAIVAFHHDDDGEWVADLSCGHGQHVRHHPPFQLRPWVVDDEGRRSRLGALLPCPLCERAELPGDLISIKPILKWDEQTMPDALRVAHRLKRGTWARIVVLEGQLRFVAHTNPIMDVVLHSGSAQAIPPDVEHDLGPIGPVRFTFETFSIPAPDQGITVAKGE